MLPLERVKTKTDRIYDKYPILASLLTGTTGISFLKDPRNISRFTGTEHLLHGTPSENVDSILSSGLKVDKSYDPNTISHIHGNKEIAEGHVFTGRTTKPISKMSLVHQFTDGAKKLHIDLKKPPEGALNYAKALLKMYLAGNPTSTLKIRIPYEQLQKLKPKADPGWTRFMDSIKKYPPQGIRQKIKAVLYKQQNKAFSPEHTYAFSRDIDSKYIKGSKDFQHGILSEIKHMPSYVVKNPGRFLRGTGKLGLGASLAGLTTYELARIIRKKLKKNIT